MENKSIVEILAEVQSKLKAPKSQYNSFGKYNYRNCEDILEALKPILANYKAIVTITDDIIAVGNRVYVKATATFSLNGINNITATAMAREPQEQKGMNEAQITGSASSYARKYALNGLFLIDDTKDADSTNDHGKAPAQVPQTKHTPEMEALKEAEAKARAKYESQQVFDGTPTQKTISGIIKKYCPLDGTKPHWVLVDGIGYATYHEGIGKQLKELNGELVHITYHDVQGKDRVHHIIDEVKKP